MANRSDFFSAKLPRQYKRMIALGEAAGHYNKQEGDALRKSFIHAHTTHVNFKLKRNTDNRDASDAE